MKKPLLFLSVICIGLLLFFAYGSTHKSASASASSSHQTTKQAGSVAKAKQDKPKTVTTTNASSSNKVATTKGDQTADSSSQTGVTSLTNAQWEKKIAQTNFMGPSDGPYPTIQSGENIWIDADVSKERIYIKNGNKTIYTMLTSSGLDTNTDDSTPQGTFYVQAEKGPSFFSPSEQEGAKYWTSWKNHGEFLFHTVPTDKNGDYIQSEAEKLGQKASHGCFRLPVLDAKWIYENIPEGTKVVIHA